MARLWLFVSKLLISSLAEACIAALMQGRLFERAIYTGKFFAAADAASAASAVRCSRPCEVEPAMSYAECSDRENSFHRQLRRAHSDART